MVAARPPLSARSLRLPRMLVAVGLMRHKFMFRDQSPYDATDFLNKPSRGSSEYVLQLVRRLLATIVRSSVRS